MNLKPLTEPAKLCPSCKKKKVVSAFNVDNSRKDGRFFYCKICHGTMKSETLLKNSKKKGRNFHLFRNGDKCIRCGIQRRDRANLFKHGRFYKQYLVNGSWTTTRPPCNVYK